MKPVLQDSEPFIGRAFDTTYYRENATESYVSIPPAAIITEPSGSLRRVLGDNLLRKSTASIWRLGEHGRDYEDPYASSLEFNVLRNDKNTGEFASKIEYRGGKVRIFGRHNGRLGWKVWNENGQYFF